MPLIELPRELIEEILTRCDPVDVAMVAQTCSTLRFIIYYAGDSKLWRDLYLLQPFDDPRTAVDQQGRSKPTPIDWKMELQRIIRARNVLLEDDVFTVLRPGESSTLLRTLLDMVTTVSPRTSYENVRELSANLLWVAAMLRRGFIDQLEESAATPPGDRQLLARLHTFYGITHADTRPQSRVKSRAYVYDMRHYRSESAFGPFLPGGKVNWEHMQALHHVVSMHLVELGEDEDFEFAVFPMSLPFTQIVTPSNLDEEKDWAGLTGSWVVSFCFCDHRDLMTFNHANVNTVDLSLLEDPEFREVFRSLAVNITVVRTEPDPNHPARPIIHFQGKMTDASNSTMTGHVKMTPDNEVLWHFVSGEPGSMIWSSEGVQVGGLRSSFGVLGSWSTIFHEEDDPVGPFWLRKHIHDIVI
ncbi:hypothetical protein BDN70DRAFT_827292 [Pholiota conissans]|uniref:F-box domain-containing protein n=1 Tax=Pholiota conissans TaxID=109636 RepID=A0A9P6D5F0_9AGAR|nr:hypothetical protein BDN70DRAFT_827292 [Pholiota conissans]